MALASDTKLGPYSPDGSRLAVAAFGTKNDAGQWERNAANSSGEQVNRVSDWSPDGHTLLINPGAGMASSSIFMMRQECSWPSTSNPKAASSTPGSPGSFSRHREASDHSTPRPTDGFSSWCTRNRGAADHVGNELGRGAEEMTLANVAATRFQTSSDTQSKPLSLKIPGIASAMP